MHYLDTLNKEQRDAVLHFGPPLLILAGAGSGKTRVITTKIAWLLDEKNYDPRSIIAVTFTNKAALEMKNRLFELSPKAPEVMIKTFHAFGAWLLRRNSHLLNLSDNFSIYDQDDMLSLIKSVIKEKKPLHEIKWIASKINQAKNKCLSPEDDPFETERDTKLLEIYTAYQNKLEKLGNVDFGDLLMKSVQLLKKHPQVKTRMQRRFEVILVDEFQDSNIAQFELLKELYSGKNYLCVVGDEDQSIYGFRGAELNNIVGFPDVYPDTRVIMLEQNYRSTGKILDLALNIVHNNIKRLGKNLWTNNPEGEPATLVQLDNQDEEALFCSHILKDKNYSGTAILYRNNYQSRSFESLFSRINIPYRIVGTLRFYEREEVKDALSYLCFLLNPKDEVSFLRIVNKPVRGIGKKSMEKILNTVGPDLIDSSRTSLSSLSARAQSGLKYFIDVILECMDVLESNTLAKSVNHIIFRTGLLDYYKEKDRACGTFKVQNLEELVNATSQYPGGKEGLARFLETTILDSSEEDPFLNADKVTLITLHNTKGLEYDRVIITGLEEGLFPYISESDDEEITIEEERRLFYVGITRARKKLYLTYCKNRLVFGEYINKYPSRFISEIPKNCIEQYLEPGESAASVFFRGAYVFHPEYGTGIVMKKWYHDEDEIVTVQFESGKYLQFITKYSKLERIFLDI